MFASVIPSIRLPRGTGIFDYAIPEGFARFVVRGSTVVIPWRGRKVDGVVLRVSKTPAVDAARIKPIIGIAALRPLPEDVVDAIEWMSERYLVSPGTVVLSLVPQAPKRRRIIDPKKLESVDTPVITKRDRRAGKKVTMRRYATATEKIKCAADVARAALAEDGSTIIVTPHLSDVASVASLLRERFGDAVVELRGDLPPTKLWTSWERALADEPSVVIGTRMAVMAPVSRLAAIAILEADSPDLKQYDQNPRFDARTVALRRGTSAGASVVLMSRGPRAEDYALRAKPGHAYVPSDADRSRAAEPDSVLADIAGSAKTDEERVLTPSALDAVSEALQSGKRVLLFHNRRGNASAVVCNDCKHVFRCPTCGVARTAHGSTLHCHRCGTTAELPLQCPKCAGTSLKMLGIGTTRLERIIKEAFPDAGIARIDADARAAAGGKTKLPDADVLIGTQLLLHDVAEFPGEDGKFGAVIATSLDDMLSHPGFRVTENAWRTVRTLKDVAAASGAKLVLQAIDGADPKIRALLADAPAFMETEIAERGRTVFPPAAELLTVTALGDTENEAHAKADRLASALRRSFAAPKDVWIWGPLRPSTPLRHGTWRSLVVVKARVLKPDLLARLATLSEDHLIDRDPEYLG